MRVLSPSGRLRKEPSPVRTRHRSEPCRDWEHPKEGPVSTYPFRGEGRGDPELEMYSVPEDCIQRPWVVSSTSCLPRCLLGEMEEWGARKEVTRLAGGRDVIEDPISKEQPQVPM